MSKIVTVRTTWVHDYNLADYQSDFDGMTDDQVKQQLAADTLEAIEMNGGGDPFEVIVTVAEVCMIPETNRKLRKHAFAPTKAVMKKIPGLGESGQDPTVWVQYHLGWTVWYITELDPETGMAVGWADGGLRRIDLNELEGLSTSFGMVVSRDLHWDPAPLSELVRTRTEEQDFLRTFPRAAPSASTPS